MPRTVTDAQLLAVTAAAFRDAEAQVETLQKQLATAERRVEIASRTVRAVTANEAISDLVKQAQVTAAVGTMGDNTPMGRAVRGFRLEHFSEVRKRATALAAEQGTPAPTDREVVASMQKSRRQSITGNDPAAGTRFSFKPGQSGTTSRALPGGFNRAGFEA
jgi:hypothetical protein